MRQTQSSCRCCDLPGGSELPWPRGILAAEPESKLGSVFPLAAAGFRVRDGASEAQLTALPSVLVQRSAFPSPERRFGGLALGRMLLCELSGCCAELASASRCPPCSAPARCAAISLAGARHYSSLLTSPNTVLQAHVMPCKERDGGSLPRAPVCLLFLKPLPPEQLGASQ